MNNGVSIDYLIVANHAEVVNGMLYLSGGGFTELSRPVTEPPSYVNNLGAAISIRVPDEESNKQHTFTIKLEKKEGGEPLGMATGAFSVGKPANVSEDVEMRIVGAIQFNTIFPSSGIYQVVAMIDNDIETQKKWRFQVNDIARIA